MLSIPLKCGGRAHTELLTTGLRPDAPKILVDVSGVAGCKAVILTTVNIVMWLQCDEPLQFFHPETCR